MCVCVCSSDATTLKGPLIFYVPSSNGTETALLKVQALHSNLNATEDINSKVSSGVQSQRRKIRKGKKWDGKKSGLKEDEEVVGEIWKKCGKKLVNK